MSTYVLVLANVGRYEWCVRSVTVWLKMRMNLHMMPKYAVFQSTVQLMSRERAQRVYVEGPSRS